MLLKGRRGCISRGVYTSRGSLGLHTKKIRG